MYYEIQNEALQIKQAIVNQRHITDKNKTLEMKTRHCKLHETKQTKFITENQNEAF